MGGEGQFVESAAEQVGQLGAQRVGVERRRFRLVVRLERAALHEQALHGIERRQIGVGLAQRAQFLLDAEQLAEEIVDMGGDRDDQADSALASRLFGSARAAIRRPARPSSVARRWRDEQFVDPGQAGRLVQIGKTQAVRQTQLGHRSPSKSQINLGNLAQTLGGSYSYVGMGNARKRPLPFYA